MTPSLDMLDWSHWQDNNGTPSVPNMELASKSVCAMTFKIGQGTAEDEDFYNYMQEAKRWGLYRGGYWFYDNRISPKVQARKCAEIWKLSPGELPIWVDWERDYPTAAASSLDDIYNFIVTIQAELPNVKVGIYTGYYFWSGKITGASPSTLNWFKQFPLWLAWYTHDLNLSHLVKIPKPWTDWDIWQYTDRITKNVSGADSEEVDGNAFNLPRDQWLEKWATEEVIIIPPDGGDGENPVSNLYDCTARFTAKVRPFPNTANTSVGSLAVGEKFQAEIVPDNLDPNNKSKIWGAIKSGRWAGYYTALEYPGNTNPISSYTPVVVTPPPNEIKLTHTIEVYSDGSIKVDGQSV